MNTESHSRLVGYDNIGSNKNMSERILDMKKRHISELREAIQRYRTLNKRESKNIDYSSLPNCCNIIVFGPSKSGKSSLIKYPYP